MANVSLSRDGRRLLFDLAVSTSRLWSYPLNGDGTQVTAGAEAITAETVHAYSPELSPDGRRLVFIRERPGSGDRGELVLRDLATGSERILRVQEGGRGEERGPPLRWSPDGSRLAYRYVTPDSAVRAGEGRAFGSLQQARVFDLRTDEEVEVTSPAQINDVPFGWSHDGLELLSTGARYGFNTAIARIPLLAAPRAEAAAAVVTSRSEGALWQASLSPNAQWITFSVANKDNSRSEIAVVSATGGTWRYLTDGWSWDDKPRWSEDGRLIYFISGRGGLLNVWALPFDPRTGVPTGTPARVTQFDGPGDQILPHIGRMEMSVRGGRLVLPMARPTGSIWMLENIRP